MDRKQPMRYLISICLLLLLTACQVNSPLIRDAGTKDKSLMTVRKEAIEAYQRRDYQTALPLYTRLTSEVPIDPELWFQLGNIHARLQQPQPAIAAYQAALKLNPSYSKAWHNMGVVQIQQSANTFTQMLQNTPVHDPLYVRGEAISQQLLSILDRKPAASNSQTDPHEKGGLK